MSRKSLKAQNILEANLILEGMNSNLPQTLELSKSKSQYKSHTYPTGIKNLTVYQCSPTIQVNGHPCKKDMKVMFSDTITGGKDGDSITFYDVKGWGQTKVTFQGGNLNYDVYHD